MQNRRVGGGTIAMGLQSAWPPAVLLVATIVVSYEVGEHSGLAHAGAFGAAVAACGMMSTSPYVFAINAVGAIGDGAAGVAALARGEGTVPAGEDATIAKTLARSYLVAAGSLGAFVLLLAYGADVDAFRHASGTTMTLSLPALFVGAMMGAVLLVAYGVLSLKAVGESAHKLAREARRLLLAVPETGGFQPNYGAFVDSLAKDAFRRMALHGAVVVGILAGTGILFRAALGAGAEAVGALLVIATVAGVLLSVAAESFTPWSKVAASLDPPVKLLGALALVLAPLFV
jgi:K(+)-stimulated pyrophosphate-energized sodium pump